MLAYLSLPLVLRHDVIWRNKNAGKKKSTSLDSYYQDLVQK